ncbi:MAG: hypothetical protein DID91_2727702654 [Candidatus Nitrotoga sp. MKT]|nr:MAG: hypothetical protein DID91_2727702654 [Candidatus Nitrotoga sp. MKT]
MGRMGIVVGEQVTPQTNKGQLLGQCPTVSG